MGYFSEGWGWRKCGGWRGVVVTGVDIDVLIGVLLVAA